MTHDFAKSRQSDVPKPRVNLTLWLITLIVASVFALFLNYLWKIKPEAEEFSANLEKVEPSQPDLIDHLSGTEVIKDLIDDDEKRFNFYKLLPEFNVEQNIKDALPKPDPSISSEGSDSQQQRKVLSYYIQTDSFRSANEADQRRAELILMGFDAKVTAVDLASKGVWYRVSVGPFETRRSVNAAQNTLAKANIIGSVRTITN